MEWTDDVAAGDWIRERLDTDFGTMHTVVPNGCTRATRGPVMPPRYPPRLPRPPRAVGTTAAAR